MMYRHVALSSQSNYLDWESSGCRAWSPSLAYAYTTMLYGRQFTRCYLDFLQRRLIIQVVD
jgi:hypothetical protein